MYDAIIVGARAAGSPAAMLLARRGYRVLVLEKGRLAVGDQVSAQVIKTAGAAALRRWGILGRVLAETRAPLIREVRFDMDHVTLAGRPAGTPAGLGELAPRRGLLDQALAAAATEAGADLVEGFTVDGLVFEGERVVGVQGRDPSGEMREYRAPIVIGADGRDSIVARLAHAPRYGVREARYGMFFATFSGVDLVANETFVRDGQAIFAHPVGDGQALVTLAVPAARFECARRGVEETFWAAVEREPALWERIAKGRRETRWQTAPPVATEFRRPYGPGWALAGDAGHVSEVANQWGLADAFLDAEQLVESVDDARSARMTWDVAMARYERMRNQRASARHRKSLARDACQLPDGALPRVLAGIAADSRAISNFLGTLTGTVPAAEFWAPANVARLLRGPAAAVVPVPAPPVPVPA